MKKPVPEPKPLSPERSSSFDKPAPAARATTRRQRLIFALGVSAAVFLGVAGWRFIVVQERAVEQQRLDQQMSARQAALEKRLARVEASSRSDRSLLEQRLSELSLKQDTLRAEAADAGSSPFAIEKVIGSIVELVCVDNVDRQVYYTGSGTVIDKAGLIITNVHNLKSDDGSLIRFCGVGFTADLHVPPRIEYVAATAAVHRSTDLAVLQIVERLDGQPLPAEFPALSLNTSANAAKDLSLGDAVYIGGYPSLGAETFTFTQGVVSGRVGDELIKTSALIDSGTSGGAAFDRSGVYIGVPTAAARGEIGGSLGYLIGADVVDRFLADYYARRAALPDEPVQ